MLKNNLTSATEGNKRENLVGKMEIMQNKDGSQSNDLRIKEMHFGVFCNYKYTGFIYSRLDGTRLFMEKYFEDGVAVSSDDSRDIRKSVKDTARYDRILALQSRHVSCSSDDDDYYARSIEEFPLNKTVVYINKESDTSRLHSPSTPSVDTDRLHKKSFMEDHFTDEGNGVPCYDLYVAGEVSGQLCEACEWMSIYDVELAFKEYLKLK